MLARAELGTTYCGCPTKPIYFYVDDENEFNSDAFSTEILNAIFNGDFDHMFLDLDLIESKDDIDEDELEDAIDCIGYDPFEEDEDDDYEDEE